MSRRTKQQESLSPARQAASRRRAMWVTVLFAMAVLIPSLYGFGTKFHEFVVLFRGDIDGVFAISPILNYLLASLGFFCLFLWATLHGMFRDIEAPKRQMLDNEWLLDSTADHRGMVMFRRPGGLKLADVRRQERHWHE